jgi:hypothetical protein
MGQFERLIIGVVITISAYRFLYDSQQRHNFHTLLTTYLCTTDLMPEFWNCTKCYCCLETVRLGVSAVIFTAGLALVLDACISLGVIVELGLLAMEAVKLKDTSCLCVYQNVMVHLLLLVILIANCREPVMCGKPAQPTQPQSAKIAEPKRQSVEEAPSHVETPKHVRRE